MTHSLHCFFLACFSLLPVVAFGHGLGREEVVFRKVTGYDDLPVPGVADILQDRYGFIWIATQTDLVRYDGKKYRRYPCGSTESAIPCRNLVSLHEDSRGVLWGGTRDRDFAVRYVRAKDRFEKVPLPANPEAPRTSGHNSWHSDSAGNLFYAPSYGLFHLDFETDQWEQIPVGDNPQSNRVSSVAEIEPGVFWLATADGAYALDWSDRSTRKLGPQQLPDAVAREGDARLIKQDSQGRIWFGMYRDGIRCVSQDGKPWPFTIEGEVGQGGQVVTVTFIEEDSRGNIWIGAFNRGILLLPAGRTDFFLYSGNDQGPSRLPAQMAFSGAVIDGEILYVGTLRSGVIAYNPQSASFAHYSEDPRRATRTLPFNQIRAAVKDSRGRVWIAGHAAQLAVFFPGRGIFGDRTASFRRNPDLGNASILSLAIDSQDNLYLSTASHGILRYDTQHGDLTRLNATGVGDALNKVTRRCELYVDRRDQLWVLRRAVYRVDLQNMAAERLVPPGGEEPFLPTVSAEDELGNLWIGGRDAGFVRFAYGSNSFDLRIDRSAAPNRLEYNYVMAFEDDGRGNLWIGSEAGLARLDLADMTLDTLDAMPELSNGQIWGIETDRNGSLWLVTSHGLRHHDFNTGETTVFTAADGLLAESFLPRTTVLLDDGRLFLGGINGINVVNPDRLPRNQSPPKIQLTDFRLFNEPVNSAGPDSPLAAPIYLTDSVKLPHDRNSLAIGYSNFNYSLSGQIVFKHRLVGLDDSWQQAGEDLLANYTNLGPGKYEFQVKAVSAFGRAGSLERPLKITIRPPYWETAYFRFASLAMLGGLGSGAWMLRHRQLRRRNELLEGLVRSRTSELEIAKGEAEQASLAKSTFLATVSHEIRTPLNGVLGMASMMDETTLDSQQRRYLGIIQNCGHGLISMIGDILDFSKIEAERLELEISEFDLGDCIGEVIELYSQKAAEKGIEMAALIGPAVPQLIRGDHSRVRQVLFNLVSNAIKFTQRGHVAIHASLERPAFLPAPHPSEEAPRTMEEFATFRDHVYITVEDTGLGIAEDERSGLFESFAQAHSGISSKYGGTGLGLAISRRLVALMGGAIGLDSSPGSGSRFAFSLRTRANRRTPEWTLSLKGKSLLAVSPHAISLESYKLASKRWQMEFAMATGLGATEMTKAFDYILIDHDPNSHDAANLVRSILEKQPKAARSIHVTLPLGCRETAAEVERAGVASVMERPCSINSIGKSLGGQGLLAPTPDGAGEADRDRSSGTQLPPLSIIVADDNRVNIEIARHKLGKLGLHPTCVSDGVDVMEELSKRDFDLVILDAQMPQMDGAETTRQIRTRAGKQPKIIIVTAMADGETARLCLESGANAVLAKPLTINEIEQAIIMICQN